MSDEGRYSKVTRRMWNDEKFRALSAPPPNAQTLWKRLLTGPELGCIPGLFSARLGGLADALGWPREATERCWEEIEDAGMAKADWSVGIVWVPKALAHNEPASPNAVAAWRKAANELPECALRAEAFESIDAYLEELGPAWIAAWRLAEDARGRPAKIGTDVRRAVQERDGNHCRYCSTQVDWNDRRGPKGATYDHVNPVGEATVDNIVVACRSCNSQKGFRNPKQAGMKLTQARPKSDLGRKPSPKQDPSLNQEQDQDQEQDPDTDPAGARVCELPMPLTWEPHPSAVKALAEWAKVPESTILAEAQEFKSYWTTGRGAGQERANWNLEFRERVRRRKNAGETLGYFGQRPAMPLRRSAPLQTGRSDYDPFAKADANARKAASGTAE